MGSWGDDIGLLYLALLNAAVLVASWRLARRRSRDALDAAGDALLLFYFVQYVSVGVTGLVGALHALTMGLVALLASAVIALGSWRIRARDASFDDDIDFVPTRDVITHKLSWRGVWLRRRGRIFAAGAFCFVIGYLAALVYHQRPVPVLSNDAITYHLPAAVQWLQTGRLGLYEAWYYNPANSWSPLGGSAWLAWLMAPMQNDSVARFAAVGPLVMLFIAVLNLSRRLGADAGVATLIAAACALARPFASQAILAKDDLFVAALFVIAVDALTPRRFATRSGPWRAGIALGLLLATKYTAILSLPLLIFLINRAWTRRRLMFAAAVVLALAGPWYLRNIILTGNPLYPSDVHVGGVTILRGMMDVARSKLLATPQGVWDVFVEGYYGLTRSNAIVLIAGWFGAAVVMFARTIRTRRRKRPGEPTASGVGAAVLAGVTDPLVRTCVFGPLVGVAIFVLVSPYGEMRFAYPSIALLFGCVAVALSGLPWMMQVIVAAAFALIAASRAFRPELASGFCTFGAMLALPAMVVALTPRRIAVRIGYGAAGVAVIALALVAYVNWGAYVRQTEADAEVAWTDRYGPIGEAWAFVRRGPSDGDGGVAGALPAGATIAYANTYFTYPLMGYRYDHRVVHVPTRRDIERFTRMPHLARRVTGEELVAEVCATLRADPDREAWLKRLKESGAQFLLLGKYDPAAPSQKIVPPEQSFAEQDPKRFVRVFDNDAASVYRIAW